MTVLSTPPQPPMLNLQPLAVSPNPEDWIPIFQECLVNTAAAATGDIEEQSLYTSVEERDVCRKLVEALGSAAAADNSSDDLKVHAANTSYAYWYLSTQLQKEQEIDEGFIITEEDKIFAAMREARRHYVYVKQNFDKALKNLTESCKYRKVTQGG